MTTLARDRIRRCLAMIPLIRARPGIRIPELASIFGVRDEEIWEDITEVLTLCGIPPYLPHNYLVFSIHGDQVSIRFAEHLSRPVHLTLQEALAIDLALRSVSGGRPPVFQDAAPRLRGKLRDLLGGTDRQALEAFGRGVAGTPPPDLVTDTIRLLKDAMARNLRVRMEYYTASRDAVGERSIEPYGLVDLRGKWYVIARDPLHDRELAFRVDRIRNATIQAQEEYEVPETFTAESFRRDEMWREGPDHVEVEVRYAASAAPRGREDADKRDLKEQADGGVIRTYRIQRQRPRWLFTHVARFGPDAEVLSPPDIRRGMALFLEEVLASARDAALRPGRPGGAVQAAETSRARATAAARGRPRRSGTTRRPPRGDAHQG